MTSFYSKTPLLRRVFASPILSATPQFLVKYEVFQPSGSFKSRGIGHLIAQSAARIESEGNKTAHVFASSGGNAGLAAATACRAFSLPCTVVVPTTTNLRMVAKIRQTGADVIVHGNHWGDADQYLHRSVMPCIDTTKFEPVYAHPFDNPVIWEGHSTIVDEIVESLERQRIPASRVKGIVCSIGGGGLYNGIIEGLEKHDLATTIPIIGVETKGCEVFHQSLKAGKPLVFDKITSVATSLGTATICKKTLENALKYNTKSVVLSDADVVRTCLNFADDTNIVPEPACGASLHFGYNPHLLEDTLGGSLGPEDIIIIIACGGSSTTVQDLQQMQVRLGRPLTTSFTCETTPVDRKLEPAVNVLAV